MPKPRHQLVDVAATPFYHCMSRLVRLAFLCGNDPLTGANFDHRKGWIAERMKQLVDICSYGLMSNHFHVVLRVRTRRHLERAGGGVALRTAVPAHRPKCAQVAGRTIPRGTL